MFAHPNSVATNSDQNSDGPSERTIVEATVARAEIEYSDQRLIIYSRAQIRVQCFGHGTANLVQNTDFILGRALATLRSTGTGQ
jgi:hypothetical protein